MCSGKHTECRILLFTGNARTGKSTNSSVPSDDLYYQTPQEQKKINRQRDQCDYIERREEIANGNTDRKLAKSMTVLTAALIRSCSNQPVSLA